MEQLETCAGHWQIWRIASDKHEMLTLPTEVYICARHCPAQPVREVQAAWTLTAPHRCGLRSHVPQRLRRTAPGVQTVQVHLQRGGPAASH